MELTGEPFKVFRGKEKVASCKHAEDAAAIVAMSGGGEGEQVTDDDLGTIRVKNLIVWREGRERQPAAESYDFVAETVHERIDAYWR